MSRTYLMLPIHALDQFPDLIRVFEGFRRGRHVDAGVLLRSDLVVKLWYCIR